MFNSRIKVCILKGLGLVTTSRSVAIGIDAVTTQFGRSFVKSSLHSAPRTERKKELFESKGRGI